MDKSDERHSVVDEGRTRMIQAPNTGSNLKPAQIVDYYPYADDETKFKYVRAISNHIVDDLRRKGMTREQAVKAAMGVLADNGGIKKAGFDYDKFYELAKALYSDKTAAIGADGKLSWDKNAKPSKPVTPEDPNADLDARLGQVRGGNDAIKRKKIRETLTDMVAMLRAQGFDDVTASQIIGREFKKYGGTGMDDVNYQAWLAFAREILDTKGKYFDKDGNVRRNFSNWRGRRDAGDNKRRLGSNPAYDPERENELSGQARRNMGESSEDAPMPSFPTKDEVAGKSVHEPLETTFYAFESHLKAFMRALLEDPADARPDDFFKERGLSRGVLIRHMTQQGLLEKEEDILDCDGHAVMSVSYKIPRARFYSNMRKLYIRLFEKNVPPVNRRRGATAGITEDDGGAGALGGATNASSSGQYVQPLFGVQRRKVYATESVVDALKDGIVKETARSLEEIEEALDIPDEDGKDGDGIEEATTTSTVGDYAYDAPAFVDKDSAYRTPGFSCGRK